MGCHTWCFVPQGRECIRCNTRSPASRRDAGIMGVIQVFPQDDKIPGGGEEVFPQV